MDNKERDILINKYLEGSASESERSRLLQWYENEIRGEVIWEVEEQEEDVKSRLKTMVIDEIRERPSFKRRYWKLVLATSAACLIGLLFVLNWSKEIAAERVVNDAPIASVDNKYVILADSSLVILKPGSSLTYRTDFSSDTREIELIGEGYFDIKRDETKPFIIHSKGVRTVVLGTAFTIKAYEDQGGVSVTVQRGKVRVERGNEVLANLVANQKVELATMASPPKQVTVEADEEISWTSLDMHFDSQSFGVLIPKLEKRYGVKILFKHDEIKSCLVNGRFDGTESLEEVLKLLCDTRNAYFFKNQEGDFWIDGEGC